MLITKIKRFENIELHQLHSLALEIKQFVEKSSILLLEAEMGAGKTTFTKEFLTVLSVENFEGSPTYSLVQSYESLDRKEILHFDLFRLNSYEEALDIGFEELIEDADFSIIEWAEFILPFLPATYFVLKIEKQSEDLRTFTLYNHVENV